MFITECWYAAGFPDEFGRSLVGRTFLREPVVLFRTEMGELVALEDRCSHRRLPLSAGHLKGDTVECAYHGLVYDCSGACIKVPGQDDVPRTARLKRYPVADMHGYSWIWMGDPARADTRTIPDYNRLSLPGLGRHRIALHVEANYQLIVDNLLDLSHLPYVHGTTTGNPPVSERASVKTERHGNTVQVKRWAENVEPAPTFVQFGGYQDRYLADLSVPAPLLYSRELRLGTGRHWNSRGGRDLGARALGLPGLSRHYAGDQHGEPSVPIYPAREGWC